MSEENLNRATEAVDRLRGLMGWRKSPPIHVFEKIRMLWGRYEAVPIRVEYVEQLADRIEELQRIADYIDNPNVLCTLPQPYRMELSLLLHGDDV